MSLTKMPCCRAWKKPFVDSSSYITEPIIDKQYVAIV